MATPSRQEKSKCESYQLTDMAIGAPGICVSHALHKVSSDNSDIAAEETTKAILRMFDLPEGIGAVADKWQDREIYPLKSVIPMYFMRAKVDCAQNELD